MMPASSGVYPSRRSASIAKALASATLRRSLPGPSASNCPCSYDTSAALLTLRLERAGTAPVTARASTSTFFIYLMVSPDLTVVKYR